MKSLKTLGAGVVLASGLFSGVAAAATSGNIAIASEYIFRGTPFGGPQVSGGLDWESGSLYAGTWVSSTFTGADSSANNNEVDFYGGFTSGAFDVGVIAYMFPGDPELSAGGSHGNAVEVYGGVSAGNLSGYVWYGLGADNSEDDEYVYIEGNLELPLSEKSSLGLHLGVFSGLGDSIKDDDEIIDIAATLNHGDFYFMVSLIPEHENAAGQKDNSLERPRFNVGYSWAFDDVL